MQVKKAHQLLCVLAVAALSLLCTTNAHAQYADGYNIPDSAFQEKHSPRRAAFLSAMIPGLGQVYNEKYWKVPIIYGGFTGLIYFTSYNNTIYQKYRRDFKYITDNDPNTNPIYVSNQANAQKLKNSWQRYRDLCIIGIGALYFLQIVDANVDAHFFNFTIDKNLAINIDPALVSPIVPTETACKANDIPLGVRCTIQF